MSLNVTKPASYWIEQLGLNSHPEGGYYRELYRASEGVEKSSLPARFLGDRCFCTSIVYLLEAHDRSVFHRIRSDETWHFYAGSPLELHQLDDHASAAADSADSHQRIVLGTELHLGQHLQWTVPAGIWFGSRPWIAPRTAESPALPLGGEYSLLGCTVSPGFDFADFEIADRSQLLSRFPGHRELIEQLT
ncbi:MAG: cupin domain-containing protein [Pirellulaceae bacterium]|nr:cupin domain-containing protein [Pirellulaceae bacterium]